MSRLIFRTWETNITKLGAGGSVIANRGFIKQFGTGEGAGVRALDPTWVSSWSALLVFCPVPRVNNPLTSLERRPNGHFYSHRLVMSINDRFDEGTDGWTGLLIDLDERTPSTLPGPGLQW